VEESLLTSEDRERIEAFMTAARICMDIVQAAAVIRRESVMRSSSEAAIRYYSKALEIVKNRLGEERANDEKSPIKLV